LFAQDRQCSVDGGDPLDRKAAARAANGSRLWLAWAAVAICTVVILGLGGAEFGAAQTSRFLYPFLRWLVPDLTFANYLQVQFWIRKTAHVTEYALLGWLAFRAVSLSLALESTLARVAALALALALAVAVTDELHQSFLPERTSSPWDVAIDLSGAFVAIAVALWWQRGARVTAAASVGSR
jgi:VanZ family protein